MAIDSILILGAGELGMCVLEAVAAHSERKQTKVSILVTGATLESAEPASRQKIQHIRRLGAGFETADLVASSTEDLAHIFGRYHTVVSCAGMELPRGTQTKVLQAVLRGGVQRYFPWQFGMDYDVIGVGSSQDLFDEQLRVREVLRGQSGTEWVIVSTGLFMSFLFVAAFGVVDLEARVVRALGAWENRITVTTPRDIGRVTAEMVFDHGHGDDGKGGGRVVYAAGDTVSYGQLADLLDDKFQTRFTRELWDEEALKGQDAHDNMVKYRRTFARGRGVAWDKDGTVNAQRGWDMVDVRRYLDAMETTE